MPLVPKPEEDEYGDIKILDVPPGFALHDAHVRSPLVPVRIDLGFFIG